MKTNKWFVYTTLFIVSLSISVAKEIPFVPSIDQIQYPVKDNILEIGVPEELANPNVFFPEVKRVVPVVIVSFLYAQQDGIHGNNIKKTYDDPQFDGHIGHYPLPPSNPENKNLKLKLSELSNWQLYSYIKGKFAVEEGSRFRGYINPNAIPNVGIKVVKHFNVYKNFPVRSNGVTTWGGADPQRSIDYHKVFKMIDLQKLVEEQGVKEVWVSVQGDEPESNMSSPVTGDVSNSHRIQQDLPIYKNTYIVYSFPSHRNYDIFLHCRAHQYEAMLCYMNEEFFNNEFVGLNKKELIAGNCHFSVNSNKVSDGEWQHYDQANTNFVQSVIETWVPYTKTQTKPVNVSYWGSRLKQLPEHIKLPVATQLNWWRARQEGSGRTVGGGWDTKNNRRICFDSLHASWYMMWFQQFPGEKPIKFKKSPNELFETYETVNWWDIIFDWDEHAKKKMNDTNNNKHYFGLYKKINSNN